jgi:hypothetical protein
MMILVQHRRVLNPPGILLLHAVKSYSELALMVLNTAIAQFAVFQSLPHCSTPSPNLD